jgi:transcriptional regulator with XRE-family HTH domain
MDQTTGQIIRAARLARGWTQKQLAEAAGVSTIAIKRLEGDQHAPSAETARRLARALSMTVDDLLDHENVYAGPLPAAKLRSWGISEAEIAQYSAAWPYWSHKQRAKVMGSLDLITTTRANVQAMTNEVQAKVRALENKANQDDDPDRAAQPLTQQITV